jgi:DNA-binding MarR family transcriptional regulator
MKNEAAMERLDHESRTQEDDHHSIRLWLRLLTCSNLIESKLRSRLREEFSITLPRFDFLAQLERAPEGLTMGELSQRMMVSGGNISGIATQLEGEGFIDRSPVEGNRRMFCVRLTPKGLAQFQRMAARHEEWVVEMLGGLGMREVNNMMLGLKKIKQQLAASEA